MRPAGANVHTVSYPARVRNKYRQVKTLTHPLLSYIRESAKLIVDRTMMIDYHESDEMVIVVSRIKYTFIGWAFETIL